MQQIKTVALIGLGAIGCSVARELCRAVGYDNFRVIAGGARRERLERLKALSEQTRTGPEKVWERTR